MLEVQRPTISPEVRERAARIELLLMDVDGVLTDGRLYYMGKEDGGAEEFKAFNSHDGLGLHFMNFAGIKTGVISGRKSKGTEERARILKMTYVYQGFIEKGAVFDEIIEKEKIAPEKIAFVGDDFIDVPLMMRSGFGVAVGNARPEVRAAAHYVTALDGGQGAVREVCEVILRARGLWNDILAKYGLPLEATEL
jgi:3-deoxy-D-manno-octulosonate 8-phosphate phosphatase (KDO 8-P phosphatase)